MARSLHAGPARLGTAALAALLLCAPADAASFNCGRAATPTEYAICGDQTLSDLDMKMATLFAVRMEIPMLMGARGAAQDEQRTWVAGRDTCGGNVACLTQAYRQRIGELNRTISAAMQDYCAKLGIC